MQNLARQAIQAALKKDWKKAEEINLTLLTQNPNDVPSLNRLSLAQTNLGKIGSAQRTLRLALGLDPSNPIALKNLKRLKAAKKSRVIPEKTPSALTGSVFLKEKGKTTTVALPKPAEPQVLSTLCIGDILNLEPKKKGIQVKKGKIYIGSLPNPLAFHLDRLLKRGYRYDVYLWKVEPKAVSVFIKEVFRPKSMEGIFSFI